MSSRIENVDGYSGLTFRNGSGTRLAALRRIGTPIFKTEGPINAPQSNLDIGDVSFHLEGGHLRFTAKDSTGQVRIGDLPLS